MTRRYLYRAAATVQQIFIHYRMAKFENKIETFISSGQGDFLNLWFKETPLGTLVNFPDELFPGVGDLMRVLSFDAEGDVLVGMHLVVAALLRGQYHKFESL